MATTALSSVGREVGLDLDLRLGVGLAGVGAGVDALRAQPLGDALRVGDGQRVDDAGAFERRQHLREPGETVGLRSQLDRVERERLAVERPADREQLLAELRLHVGDDAVVGRRGRTEHRNAGREQIEDAGEAAVVGTEVVTPVADAVHLVDDEQTGAGRDHRQHAVAELRVREPLGRDEQRVDGVRLELVDHLVPRLRVVAVDRGRAHAAALGRFDLVAHEAEQRRDEQRRARAAGAEQRGGDEVDRALPPARALHDEHTPTLPHERVDRFELTVAELGRRIADEHPQRRSCFLGQVHLAHARTVPARWDTVPRRRDPSYRDLGTLVPRPSVPRGACRTALACDFRVSVGTDFADSGTRGERAIGDT